VQDDAKNIVMDLLQRATVCQLRDDADELGALVRAILAPLPTLPSDPVEREKLLAVSLYAKDNAARRLLAWVISGL
jgi:hypothetical protein